MRAGPARPARSPQSHTLYTHTYRHDGLRHSRQSPTTTYVTLHEAAGMEETLTREVGNLPGGGSVNRAYHLAAQGSVAAVTDASPATVTRYETDAWGNVLSGLVAEEPAIYGGGYR